MSMEREYGGEYEGSMEGSMEGSIEGSTERGMEGEVIGVDYTLIYIQRRVVQSRGIGSRRYVYEECQARARAIAEVRMRRSCWSRQVFSLVKQQSIKVADGKCRRIREGSETDK